MKKRRKKRYDLNSLVQIVNVFFCGLGFYVYYILGDNEFINFYSIILLFFFAVLNVGILSYEKRKKTPFLIILVLLVTFFYMLRIVTLNYLPASGSFLVRSSVTVDELNYALLFILFSNISMFLGFCFGRSHMPLSHTDKKGEIIFFKLNVIIVLFFLSMVIPQYLLIAGRLIGYIRAILLNNTAVLLLVMTSTIFYYKKISLINRVILSIFFLSCILIQTLSGSRGGLLTIGILLLISTLVVKQKILISKKVIIILLIIVPIGFCFFAFATLKRQLSMTNIFSEQQFEIVEKYNILTIKSLMDKTLINISRRVGFLDYSTELIVNRQKFAPVINGKYYVRSIIDNVLTPGLGTSIFGTEKVLKASIAIPYLRKGRAIPSRNERLQWGEYQSDQMGIYGESYVLFYGYLALIALFFYAFFLQRIYIKLNSLDTFTSYYFKAVLLCFFYLSMNSFGTDWISFDIITICISSLLLAKFCIKKNKISALQ